MAFYPFANLLNDRTVARKERTAFLQGPHGLDEQEFVQYPKSKPVVGNVETVDGIPEFLQDEEKYSRDGMDNKCARLEGLKQPLEIRLSEGDTCRRKERGFVVDDAQPGGRRGVLPDGAMPYIWRERHERATRNRNRVASTVDLPGAHAFEDVVDLQSVMDIPPDAMRLPVLQHADALDERHAEPYAFEVFHGDILPQNRMCVNADMSNLSR